MIHAFYGMTRRLDAASELYDEISAHVRLYLAGAEPTHTEGDASW
jgi:hypothetical protein